MILSPESHKIYVKKLRQKCKANGICTECYKAKAKEGVSKCEPCLEHHRQYRRNRISNGDCPDCGTPANGGYRCPICEEYENQRQIRARAL